MPEYKKLTERELAAIRGPVTGQRARVREEYRGYLEGLKKGEGGELKLQGEEKKITVKNRLKRAAEELSMSIVFKRSGPNIVRFQIASTRRSG